MLEVPKWILDSMEESPVSLMAGFLSIEKTHGSLMSLSKPLVP